MNAAQKIFGYFDKSQLINLFELILKGEEQKVINIYRKIYDQGVEPKVFINDFLEILYYFKNIDSLSLESTNFSLNDEEFTKIKDISNQVNSEVLILFWQFAISSLEELDIVSNQHLSIEMFLIRLMHLSSIKLKKNLDKEDSNDALDNKTSIDEDKQTIEDSPRIIDQIKNIAQEEKYKPEVKPEIKALDKSLINSFDDLLNICTQKKEIKLKYELEKNVNLVKFERNRIEISFNDNLDKDFVKDLSSKLYEWTSKRWIITFSKSKGDMTVKEKQKNKRDELINEVKSLDIYKKVMEKFPDAELIDVKVNEKKRIKMTDFTKILDKAKELEAKMKESQEKIKEIRAEGVSGSNSVKVTLDGEGEMQKIELSEEIIKEDKTIIEDLIVAAHNSAKSQLKTKTTEEISKATGGFGIPGFKWPL